MITHTHRHQSGQASLHPIIWIAAIAVILFAAVGIAKTMGWIGAAPSTAAEQIVSQASSSAASSVSASLAATSAPASVATAPATPPRHANSKRSDTTAAARNDAEPAYPPATRVAQVCSHCGTVESVRAVQAEGQGTGVGAVGGAAVGGVLGHQVGKGSGKDVATVAGALLGGLAGHQIEKRVRTETHYEIAVRMDDGSRQVFTDPNAPSWQQGDRVRVVNGGITRDTRASGSQTL
ncbi:MAG: glycine zipper 2TM domain-containing protein [Rhodocyclaceae bacterium]|jgi:outer membrane lipoprotein SlyB